MTKPFAIDELLTRLRALSRRSPAESQILEVLVYDPKDLVTKHFLLTTVWGRPMRRRVGTCGSTSASSARNSSPSHPGRVFCSRSREWETVSRRGPARD